MSIIIIGIIISGISCSTSNKVAYKSYETLLKEAVKKVAYMQKIIGFSAEKAEKLKKVEFDYLKQVQSFKKEKVSEDVLKEKLQELNHQKDAQLQKILERDQYLKYDAIENNRIKKGVIMAD